MSAPDTNIKTQEKRHKPSLFGIAVSLGFAAVLLTAFLFWLSANGNAPEGAAVQIDGRTGAAVPVD